MSRNVLVSCGKVKEADQVEVEIMKQGEKFCGIVYCAIPEARSKYVVVHALMDHGQIQILFAT